MNNNIGFIVLVNLLENRINKRNKLILSLPIVEERFKELFSIILNNTEKYIEELNIISNNINYIKEFL